MGRSSGLYLVRVGVCGSQVDTIDLVDIPIQMASFSSASTA
jgi:purine-nucleoside phosphorylase